MKRMMTLIAAALSAFAAWAADITSEQARTVAENFVAKDAIALRTLPNRTVDTVTQRGGLYLVTLKPSGYLFVSVNRSAEPIPAFSENAYTEPEVGSPDAAIMANVEANAIAATGSAYESKWRTLLGQKTLRLTTSSAFVAQNIGPLLPTTWNQCSPYTDFAPVNTTSGAHMPNGCVAVAYSQIMRYWCWPEKVEEDWSFSHLADSTPGYDQQMKAGTEIDWSAMLGDYVTGIKQVTKSNTLQLGLGQILASIITEMKFQKEASGAELSRYSQNPWYTFPRSINNLSDTDGTYTERYQWARESIIKEVPMMIGIDVGTTGHAIVGDGWMETTETDGKIHLNYGWGGGSNDKWVSFASSGIKSYMLDCVPRPMVIAEPTPVESALPLKVKWLFPTKGYEDTLNGFSIAYAKVLDETSAFEDDFSDTKGIVRGSYMSVRTLSGCDEDSQLLAIGTDVNVDRNTFTWPSVFVGTNSKLTFKYRSDHALNMSVLIEAFDANTSWQLLKKLELNDADASAWQDVTIDLADYANKAVAFRVRATRPSAKAANYSGKDYFGVQIDDWKITNVHSLETAKTVTATKSARSYTFEDGALDSGATYVFTITPDVADGEASMSSCSTIVASPADKALIWGVQSIHSGDSQFSEGLYRECFLGTNQFAVYASDTTTDLKAYLSNLALMDQTKVLDTIDNTTWLTVSTNVSVSNSIKVEKATNGKFLVTLDFSHLTSAAKNANEMVTLEASDALGNVDRKYVMLHFSQIGNETAITKEQIPAYGGTIPSEEEEEEEEQSGESGEESGESGESGGSGESGESGETDPYADLPTKVEPMLKTLWKQDYPFYNLMPMVKYSSGSYTRSPVGCVGTAYAQLLRYWNWPEVLDEEYFHEHQVGSPTLATGYEQHFYPWSVFKWWSMAETWSSSLSTQQELDLARASMLSGMMADMQYKTSSSQSKSETPTDNQWFTAVTRVSSDDADLTKKMRLSLKNGCPFMVSVTFSSGDSHSVVCDGWDESNGDYKVHLNYGMTDTQTGYYPLSVIKEVYLYQKPIPAVIMRSTPVESASSATIKWAFPKKGYKDSLTGFEVAYSEVSDTASSFEDSFASELGEVNGENVSVETVSGIKDDPVLRFGTSANRETYTWGAVVPQAGSQLKFDIRSTHAMGMKIDVQVFDSVHGWQTLSTPTLTTGTDLSDWTTETIDLSKYAGHGIALRIRSVRTGNATYSDAGNRAIGVFVDNVRMTQVRQIIVNSGGKVTAGATDRQVSVGSLSVGKTYAFKVTPKFSDDAINGIAGVQTVTTIRANPASLPYITSVESVAGCSLTITDGIKRNGYRGLNQLAVYGSSTMSDLKVYLSHTAFVDQVEDVDAVTGGTLVAPGKVAFDSSKLTVTKKSNGNFLVSVDFSQLSAALNQTQLFLTLVALDDLGNATAKDFYLALNNPSGVTGETAITMDQFVEKTPTTVSYVEPDYDSDEDPCGESGDTPGEDPDPDPGDDPSGDEPSGGDDPADPEESDTYTVTFNPNGGTVTLERTVAKGGVIGALPEMVRDGYTLEGWYTEATGGSPINALMTVNADVTYFAHWKESSGGEDPGDEPSGGDPVDDGNTRFCHGVSTTSGAYDVTRSTTWNALTPVGYNLIFWWVDRYEEVNAAKPSDYVAPSTSSIPSDGSYTIQSYTALLLDSALKTTLSAGEKREPYFPTTSYTASDWNDDATGSAAVKAAGRHIYSALANGPIGIKVIYSLSRSYGAVIWGCDYATDGTDKYATAVYISDTTSSTRSDNSVTKRTLASCETYDNNFSGVGLKSFNGNDGVIDYYYPITGPAGSSGGDDEPTVKTFIVTFDSDGGSTINAQSVEDGKTLASIPKPTKDGYTFDGWYKDDEKLTTATEITANVTYTARWTVVTPEEPEDPEDPEDPEEPEDPEDPVTPDEPVISGQQAGGNAVDTGTISTTYGYRLVYNYWLARKLALQEKKKLFILSGASWCSYCTHTKEYLQGLGTTFTDKFVVYYVDRDNLANSPYFKGGLPQYGSADPLTVNPFAGIYGDATSGTPDWTKAWYASGNGLYYGNRGGFSQDEISRTLSAASDQTFGDFERLEIRGPKSVMSDKANTYQLYAIFTDGSEMAVDHGVTWSLMSGAGTMAVSTSDGDASTKLTVTSDQAVLRAESTYYFSGTVDLTIKSTQESKIKGLAIVTETLNLEDNRSPVLEATATLEDDTVVAISGVGTWTINSYTKKSRSDAELESSQVPVVTVDEFGQLTYDQGYQFDVYDHTLNVTLTANGVSVTKDITVWGPTKVAPVSWTLASKTKRLTRYGVVRLKCSELKYNYGGEIKTTSDTYYGNFRTVMQFAGSSSEYSYLRGLAFMSSKTTAGTWTMGLQSQRVNGQYQYWTPENFASYHSESIENVAEGDTITDADHGLVPQGFFDAYWQTECAGKSEAELQAFALLDSDEDGFANWQEYILGTDPTDKSDALYLTQGYQHLTAPANDLEAFQYKIMFAQRPGRYYYIYAKENWGDEWTRVAKINYSGMAPDQGLQITVLNETKANNGNFFRVGAVLADHEFNALSSAEVIPDLLVAAPNSVIDLTSETLPLNLISFDTDATHAGTVNVKVPESARTPGKVLISAPKTAKTSLEACMPYESGDVEFEIVEDPDDASRMVLKVKGEEPVMYESPFMFIITENTNWSDIEWTDKNGHTAKWADLGAGSDAEVVLEASSPFVVTVDADVTVSTVTADENVTLKFENAWPTGFATALVKDAWQGTVLIADKTDCTGTAGCTFENLGNANSVVAFDNVSGWFNGFASNASNLKGKEYAYTLKIGAGGLTINNGSSNAAATFAKLTGSGALSVGKSGDPKMRIVALDASAYTGTLSVIGNAGLIIGNPTVNAANGEIRAEGTALASATYKIGGSGVLRLGQSDTTGKYNLSAVVSTSVFADGFTGTLALGKGRYVYTANCVPSNVKISVEDGAQLFVSDGVTVANAVTIAGNGWGGETQYAVSKAALRLGNNAVLSGTLTVASDAKIGVHDGNTGTLNGVVSGAGTLTKWAGGTLLLSKATSSNFTGRFVVGQGTAKANTGSVNFFGCNMDAKAIIVEKGATFDMNGKHSADLTICLNGGTLTNTGTGITSGKKTIRKIILTDDSTLSGSQSYGLIASNYAESSLDLQGHTLTFAMTAGKDFWMPNTTATNGTIVVQSGRFYPWHAGSSKTSRYYCTVRLEGGEFKVQGNSTVDTLVLAGGSITDTYTLTIVKGLAVEKTTTISRAITLGDDATVSLAAGTSLTVNTQIAAGKFTLPPKCRLITTQSGSTYTYTCHKNVGTIFFAR